MYVKRDIRHEFEKRVNHYKIIAVVGPRQAGKTTFLKEQAKNKKSTYVLFDDPDAKDLFELDIKRFENQYIKDKEFTILDEIQNCKEAGPKLKYLADTGSKLWITSSSETILGKEVLAHLVGRVSILRLYPFSLSEFLDCKKQKETTPTILKREILEHISYGGYPKVVTTNDKYMKKTILRDLYETTLLKDVARTFSIEDMNSLEKLAKYLAVNTGGLLSYDTISNDLSLSFQTLKKYIDALEKSYVIITITPYFTNKLKEIVKRPKIYFMDTGVRNLAASELREEITGRLFENYVLLEFLKSGIKPKYWRTKAKAEVDFIIEKENEIIPVEIKLNADTRKAGSSLRAFINFYKPKKAVIVSYEPKKETKKINECEVIYTDIKGLTNLLNNPVHKKK